MKKKPEVKKEVKTGAEKYHQLETIKSKGGTVIYSEFKRGN